MVAGLRALLSPQEQLALRRVAHAAPTVDTESIGRLLALALVEPIRGGWRLTATGKMRLDALPQATLVKGGPSARMTAMFIDGLLEKATAMARAQGFATISETAARTNSVATTQRRPSTRRPPPVLTLFELAEWRARAKGRLEASRLMLLEQRRSHSLQVAESHRCMELSRLLLATSAPRWPAWWSVGPDTSC
jgi:hypothetical protein